MMRFFLLMGFILLLLSGCAQPEPPAWTPGTDTPKPAPTLGEAGGTPQPAPTATSTVVPPLPSETPTPFPTLEPRPPANATALRLEIGAQYSASYWLQVVSFPEDYIGDKVVMEGIIFEIIDPYGFRMRLPDNSPAYVVSVTPLSDLNIGDEVSVYATMQGQLCAYNGAMRPFCQILLNDARVGR